MPFDLTAMVRRATNRRTPVTVRAIVPTKAQADDLARIYLKVVRMWSQLASERIMPAYARALERKSARDGLVLDDVGEVGSLFEELGPALQRLLLLLTPELRDWAIRVEEWHRGRWASGVLTATGVDISTMLGPQEMRQTVEEIIAWNISLIRDVSAQAQAKIASDVFAGYQRRAPAREVAKAINETLQTSQRRSVNIAADQLQKLSSRLDEERQREAGIDHWKWRHSRKLHPRAEHKARDGNIYTAKTAPKDLPGQLPWCGCKRQAMLIL